MAKLSKICSNQHADLLRFLLTKDSLKIKKSLDLVSTPHFSQKIFIFLFRDTTQTGQILLLDCLLPKLFSKMYFKFYTWAFDGIMTFVSACNCSLLNLQNKPAKM